MYLFLMFPCHQHSSEPVVDLQEILVDGVSFGYGGLLVQANQKTSGTEFLEFFNFVGNQQPKGDVDF